MEPLDEQELKQLLARWEAPPAPASLRESVLQDRMKWWRWLISGTIRVPVPIGMLAIALLAIWLYSTAVTRPKSMPPQREEPVLMKGFKPVEQLTPVIIRRSNEGNAKEK